MAFEVRTAADPMAVASGVRDAVRQIEPGLATHELTTEVAHINQSITNEIMLASLCSAFAALALVIACVGLYGTVSFNVARRTREIGIRSALGATGARLVWMVQRDVLTMAIAGLLIGVPLALAGSRFVKSFLFGVTPNDPVALGIGTAVLLTAALVAGYLPARRASRIDPLRAMRCD
jgi:ABC-type antimicrobial peptide transport system permease subunit